MKTFIGALALVLAIPAAAQTAPASNPHARHGQHQQGGGQQSHHRAKMMDECKKAMAEGKCKEHCEAMMKQHAAGTPGTAQAAHAHAH